MSVLNTLEQASYAEVTLSIEDGQLRMAAPTQPPAKLLENFKANKSLLIKHLELYQDADFETAKAAWYSHYWSCNLCKSHHTKLRPPTVHPCNEGELLNKIYNETIC